VRFVELVLLTSEANNTSEVGRKRKQPRKEDIVDLFDSCHLDTQDQSVRKDLSLSKKLKVKTRPDLTAPAIESPNNGQNRDNSDRTSHHHSIPVSAESLRIFQRMFSTKTDDRDTKWLDLVSALVDAGFKGIHTGGSAVTFTHEKQGGAITIHRLHPDPTMTAIRVRRLGKRLSKWFGWSEETFVEREKE
jgi:predicted RNA binding protein YcfA (HicA-like mRNA interferase family)